MTDQTGNIWRPSMQPNETPLPLPGEHQQSADQVYTQTSLAINQDVNFRNLNREILNASQTYNSSPKPFSRQGVEHAASSSASTLKLNHQTSHQLHGLKPMEPQQVVINRFEPDCLRINHQITSNESHAGTVPSKLVHKQYNSPLDLYSMNNIRKTIEAHSELIAPGVKGINFMKPEAPINKQSEVYKLVKQEEEEIRSHVSPVASQPVHIQQTGNIDLTSQHNSGGLCQQSLLNTPERVIQQSQMVNEHCMKEVHQSRPTMPICCECGLCILGPFAKIQNRFVHPHCFNCTTCGTSLKNTGYFTVNEKLYCDIHAKQVAKMMHIQYDFDRKVEQNRQQQLEKVHSNQIHQQPSQAMAPIRQDTFASLPVSSPSRPSSSLLSSSATISTMFADRSSTETSKDRQEIKWTWRPAGSRHDRASSVSGGSSTMRVCSGGGSMQQSPSFSANNPTAEQTSHPQTLLTSTYVRGRGFEQESLSDCGRLPMCVQCRVQIHGPYILAGKTTWCKSCSQTNFNCNSCRRSLLDIGFIEDSLHKYYCEHCYEAYYAPVCSKCNLRIKGDCLNALDKQWHPSCFVCGHCHRPFGNSSFYLEDNVPYCERDWNLLFTTKCYSCSYPIEAGDKWIEALDRNYHSNCFRCTMCQANLEGSTFYCKNGKPYCRMHAG